MNTDTPVHELRDEAAAAQGRTRPTAPDPADERWTRKSGFYPDDPRRKSPALATIMSIMPGLGQVYVGYYQQGFINILVVAGIITLLSTGILSGLEPMLGVFLAFFWLYNLVDAGRRATFYNQALAGLDKAALPDDMRLPTGRGALAGGVALVALGLVAFSNTMFGVSLEWLDQWWPVALIAGGGYLIYLSQQDRGGKGSDDSAAN